MKTCWVATGFDCVQARFNSLFLKSNQDSLPPSQPSVAILYFSLSICRCFSWMTVNSKGGGLLVFALCRKQCNQSWPNSDPYFTGFLIPYWKIGKYNSKYNSDNFITKPLPWQLWASLANSTASLSAGGLMSIVKMIHLVHSPPLTRFSVKFYFWKTK